MPAAKKVGLKAAARKRAITASQVAEVGMVLLDLSLRPVGLDRGAAALFAYSIPSNAVGRPAFRIPAEVLDLLRNRSLADLADLSVVKRRFRHGENEYTYRAHLIEPQSGAPMEPLLALYFERCSSTSDAIQRIAAEHGLTDREEEVFRAICMGLSSKEIADQMGIAPNTVRVFLRLAMIKMGVR